MPFFQTKEHQLFFEQKGSGRSLVFLHGFLEDYSMWENIIPMFKNLHVLTVDLPCHGNSRYSDKVCSMKTMAIYLHELLNKLGIENPTVIGHSMGGYVGLELSRLRSINLVLLHSNFWADSFEKKKDRNRVIDVVNKNHSFFIQEAIPGLFYSGNITKCQNAIQNLIEKAKKMNPNEIAAATAGMRDRNDHTSLMEHNPITIIHGEQDSIIKTSQLLESIKNLTNKPIIITLKGVGHMSIWEDPEQLISSLKTIIN